MTSPRFLHWFVSNAFVFRHCVLVFEDVSQRRMRERESVKLSRSNESRQKRKAGGDEKTKQAHGRQPSSILTGHRLWVLYYGMTNM